ncbi:MAG: LysE family transporter [Puniceicoccales bacterium]|jgi:RhtB (resistance to homoserine/threonine) family protein|nr:LysE family transporter [Puniceicoccales bacterium]
MESFLTEFLLVASVHALAVASPGPDFAIVLHQSIHHGRRAALLTSLGIASGIFFHAAYCLFGLGWLLQKHPAITECVKYAGAAYLAWLGTRMLFAKKTNSADADATPDNASAKGAFWRGLWVNVLNPKVALFFIALFSTVVDPAAPIGRKAFYGTWMALITATWFSGVSFFFTNNRVRRAFLNFGHWFDRIMGILLIFLALRLAAASLSAP